MVVRDLIKSPVITCTPTTVLWQVQDLMNVKNISAIPVISIEEDDVTLLGIVTRHDLAGVVDHEASVQQIMTPNVQMVHPETTVQEAAQVMIRSRIHHLVVKDNQIRGIISSFDFVKIIAETTRI